MRNFDINTSATSNTKAHLPQETDVAIYECSLLSQWCLHHAPNDLVRNLAISVTYNEQVLV